MIIRSIKIKNFKSVGELELNFTNLKGVYEISGLVGAGKTTIGEAILYGLFGTIKHKNNRDLVRWGCKESEITLDLFSKNMNITIHRTIKGNASTVSASADGETIISTNKKDIQNQLENDYYDVSRVVIETLLIISFNNFKSISSMNVRDTRDFLDKVFNMNVLTDYVSICNDFVKELQVEERISTNNISNYENQIKTINDMKALSLISDNEYEHAIAVCDEINNKLQDVKCRQTTELAKLRKSIDSLKGNYQVAVNTRKDVMRQIEFIKKEICPTCGAKISKDNLDVLTSNLESLNNKIKQLENSIKTKLSEYSNAENEFIESANNLNKDKISYENTIANYKHQKLMLKAYENTISDIGSLYENEKIKLENIKKDICDYSKLARILNTDTRINIMKNIVPILNRNIEYYSYKLGLAYNIVFDDEFSCSISHFDKKDIPISNLSTGQGKIIDMIIILAIIKLLMKSMNSNVLFLDELFSNIDNELKDTVCKLLKDDIGDDFLIFIISHSGLSDDMVNGKIIVERDKNTNLSSYFLVKNDDVF